VEEREQALSAISSDALLPCSFYQHQIHPLPMLAVVGDGGDDDDDDDDGEDDDNGMRPITGAIALMYMLTGTRPLISS
jgi:hypothetical protein